MPTIGLLEGFSPTQMRVRPSIMLGNDFDLVSARGFTSLRRSNLSYLRGENPGTSSVVASISAGAGASMQALYTNAYNAAIASGKSDAEAKAAGGDAVRTQGAPIVAQANTRIEEARKPQIVAVERPVLIDDYQGVYPQGNRGGSGSVPGAASYTIPVATKPAASIPIDTRGNSVAAYGEAAPTEAPTSNLILPVLAAAAYFLFK